ncbi:MAG TPA: hypothetical protein VHA56_20610 [Mucilaginibacter sp.]|nr:hypothetical protein [Mucilaginibacter sp.]
MNRKDLLIRQNVGRKEIDNYISKLNNILHISLQKSDFLDLEKTDEIKNLFYESFNTSTMALNKTYNDSESIALTNDIEILAQQFQHKEVYLITKESEVCGAVKIPSVNALNNFMAVIKLDGDSLNLITTDYLSYIYLDYYEEYGKFFYQLSVWGSVPPLSQSGASIGAGK